MKKIALITGATAGFGKSSVKKFIEDGWGVIATGRREDRLLKLKEQYGESLHCLNFDIQDSSQVEAAIKSLPSNFENIEDGKIEQNYIHGEEPYITEMTNFIKIIKNEIVQPYTFEEDLKILKILNLIENSSDNGQKQMVNF